MQVILMVDPESKNPYLFSVYGEQIISEADFKEGHYLIRNVKVKVDESNSIYFSSNKNTKIKPYSTFEDNSNFSFNRLLNDSSENVFENSNSFNFQNKK